MTMTAIHKIIQYLISHLWTIFQAVLPPVIKAVQAIEKCGLQYEVFDNVRVEPTDSSFIECIEFARKANPDAFLGKCIFLLQFI